MTHGIFRKLLVLGNIQLMEFNIQSTMIRTLVLLKSCARINDYVWQDANIRRCDLGASCNKFMGQVVTDLLRIINVDLPQRYILHQFISSILPFRT